MISKHILILSLLFIIFGLLRAFDYHDYRFRQKNIDFSPNNDDSGEDNEDIIPTSYNNKYRGRNKQRRTSTATATASSSSSSSISNNQQNFDFPQYPNYFPPLPTYPGQGQQFFNSGPQSYPLPSPRHLINNHRFQPQSYDFPPRYSPLFNQMSRSGGVPNFGREFELPRVPPRPMFGNNHQQQHSDEGQRSQQQIPDPTLIQPSQQPSIPQELISSQIIPQQPQQRTTNKQTPSTTLHPEENNDEKTIYEIPNFTPLPESLLGNIPFNPTQSTILNLSTQPTTQVIENSTTSAVLSQEITIPASDAPESTTSADGILDIDIRFGLLETAAQCQNGYVLVGQRCRKSV